MRQICYSVAMSLDGYIAGPQGEADWILMDPEIDFQALFARFDTVLIGRRSWEGMTRGKKKSAGMPGMKTFVLSRTLRPSDYPKVTIVGENEMGADPDIFVQPSWWSLALLAPGMLALAVLASTLPARRAARVEVAEVLRYE